MLVWAFFEWHKNYNILFYNHKHKNPGLKTSSYSNLETGVKPVLLKLLFNILPYSLCSHGDTIFFHFQIHERGGPKDKMLYNFTLVLAAICSIGILNLMYRGMFPKGLKKRNFQRQLNTHQIIVIANRSWMKCSKKRKLIFGFKKINSVNF